MEFNKYNLGILLRVCLLVASIFTISFLPLTWSRLFTWIVVLSIILLQILSLIYFCNREQLRFNSFLEHLGNADATFRPTKEMRGNSLFSHMEKAADVFLQTRLREQEQYYLLRHIMDKTSTGFLLVDTQLRLQLANDSAYKWLDLQLGQKVDQLSYSWEDLSQLAQDDQEGALEIVRAGKKFWLTIHASKVRQGNSWYCLLTLTDVYAHMRRKEMNAWQSLTRTLNHEIMNSVTPISSLAETALAQLPGIAQNKDTALIRLKRALETIHTRSQGLYDFVQEFRKLTKAPRLELKMQQVAIPLEEAMELLKPRMDQAGIELQKNFPSDLSEVPLDGRWVVQVFLNLFGNAIDALHQSSEKVISINMKENAESIWVRIHDTGPGIPIEQSEQLFEPFFSTKEHGTGIGLTFSQKLMQLHGGQLYIDPDTAIGAAFVVLFQKTATGKKVSDASD
jgi:nitrogen fixation/metabolism regulation signal transduction histidine kinase